MGWLGLVFLGGLVLVGLDFKVALSGLIVDCRFGIGVGLGLSIE